MIPTISLNNRRSEGLKARNAAVISASVYDDELNLDAGPSPVPSQCARTFSKRAKSIKCLADRCGSLSLSHLPTTCGVTSSLEATDFVSSPAVSIESLSLDPKSIRLPETLHFRMNCAFVQCRELKSSGFGDVDQKSSLPRPFPRRGFALHVRGFFIRSVHASYFCPIESLNSTQVRGVVL